jgi:phosphoribosylanthranilate isomerase
MIWVKICGTTSLADAEASVAAGADALGFIFAPSPRRIEPAAAAAIIAQLPPKIEKVGVFVNESPARIREVVREASLTAVQLHGDESLEFASSLFPLPAKRRPRIYRALSMKRMFSAAGDASFLRETAQRPPFDALLIDSGSPTRTGGTGLTFDWTRARPIIDGLKRRFRVIVAGGLRADNVAHAIALFRPWGVDVASGVEAAPGRKDHDQLRAFVAAVRQADQ